MCPVKWVWAFLEVLSATVAAAALATQLVSDASSTAPSVVSEHQAPLSIHVMLQPLLCSTVAAEFTLHCFTQEVNHTIILASVTLTVSLLAMQSHWGLFVPPHPRLI